MGLFGLHSRAWQFAVAGLAVAVLPQGFSLSRRWADAGAMVGGALIALAVGLFDSSTPFPGAAALLPVAGTLLILVSGHNRSPLGDRSPLLRLLESRPARGVGVLSYSWYLWHWPLMIVLTAAAWQDTVTLRLGAAALALAVAFASYRWIEAPIRHSVRLRNRTGATYALGIGLTVVALTANGALYLAMQRGIASEPFRELEEARQSFRETRCEMATHPSFGQYCEGGDREADVWVMLMGDSHAAQWMAAFGAAGEEMGIRIRLRSMGACASVPPADGVGEESRERGIRECAEFQRASAEFARLEGASAVVLIDAIGSKGRMYPEGPERWAASAASLLLGFREAGIPLGMLTSAPASNDPLLCLSRGRSEERCTPRYEEAMGAVERYRPAVERIYREFGVPVMDVNGILCSSTECSLEADGAWTFAASGHLTQAFTLAQRGGIHALLFELLRN